MGSNRNLTAPVLKYLAQNFQNYLTYSSRISISEIPVSDTQLNEPIFFISRTQLLSYNSNIMHEYEQLNHMTWTLVTTTGIYREVLFYIRNKRTDTVCLSSLL